MKIDKATFADIEEPYEHYLKDHHLRVNNNVFLATDIIFTFGDLISEIWYCLEVPSGCLFDVFTHLLEVCCRGNLRKLEFHGWVLRNFQFSHKLFLDITDLKLIGNKSFLAFPLKCTFPHLEALTLDCSDPIDNDVINNFVRNNLQLKKLDLNLPCSVTN